VDKTATPKTAPKRNSETPTASERAASSQTPRGSVGDYMKGKALARRQVKTLSG
jgi:hypothetical protein